MANANEQTGEPRVLILNQEFPPLGGPAVQRVTKFVRYLQQAGWSVTVIAGTKSTWHTRRDETLLKDIASGVDVFRLPFRTIEDYAAFGARLVLWVLFPLRLFLSESHMRDRLHWLIRGLLIIVHPEPLMSWWWLATSQAIALQRRQRYDVVLTSGPPHITHMVGYVLQWLFGVKWVADLRDPWVNSKAQMAAYPNPIVKGLHRLWERLVFRAADRLVTVSPTWGRLLGERCGTSAPSEKVQVIYNGYDPHDLPQTLPSVKSRTQWQEYLWIHYNGNTNSVENPYWFFRALAQLASHNAKFSLQIRCTFTGLTSLDVALVEDLGLQDIVVDVHPLSHNKSLRMSAEADVLLLIVNLIDSTVAGQYTGKVYEYVALGKPILALVPIPGDLYDFLKNYEAACVLAYNNITGIAQTIQEYIAKKQRNALHASQAPSWIAEYTRESQTKRLIKILDAMRENTHC
jgi:hypothetical protein